MYPLFVLVAAIYFQPTDGKAPDPQQVLSANGVASRACKTLHSRFPNQTVFTGHPGYEECQATYWSIQQSELRPACRFLPTSSEDVRAALEVFVRHNTNYAVVSGGHSSNTGASTIGDGIVLDLSSLSEVTLADDNEAVYLGPGARWSDVYAALEPHGLIVAGGRVAHVGVGGYVLGGGFSWFANQEGWSCDNVLEFEVVSPDSQVLHASESVNEDLLWALKGSLGIFGIVTRIKMRTIANSGIYGGMISYGYDKMPEVLAAMAIAALNAEQDIHTQSYVSVGYSASLRSFSHGAYMVNTAANRSTSSILRYLDIPYQHSSLRDMSIRESAEEISASNPLGFRRSKFAFTSVPNLEVMLPLLDLFRSTVYSFDFGRAPEVMTGISFQPLTRPMLRAQNRHGGNIFSESLTTELMPLLLVSVELWWKKAEREKQYEGFMKGLEHEMLGSNGVGWAQHPWVYPNYAAWRQNPFEERRLGKRTLEKLRQVKKQYGSDKPWDLRRGIWDI